MIGRSSWSDSLGNVTWINGPATWDGAEHSVMTFPEYEIQPGDSWTVKTNDRVGSAAPIYTKYRLSRYDRKIIVVFLKYSRTLQETIIKILEKVHSVLILMTLGLRKAVFT